MIKQILLKLLLLILAVPLAAQHDYQIVEKKGKLGLIHQQTQTVVPIEYQYIGEINYPLVIVGKGEFELNPDFELMDVGKKAKLGVYNIHKKKEVLPCKYNWVSIKNNQSILVYSGSFDTEYGYGLKRFYAGESGFGLFDCSGQQLIKCQQSYIDNQADNVIVIAKFETKKNHWYVDVARENDNWRLAALANDEGTLPLFSLVNSKGEILNAYEFSFIGPFCNGLAVVCKSRYSECTIEPGNEMHIYGAEGKMGYINTVGQVVIPLIFDKAQTFKNGKAKVENNGREFYIDKFGNEIE